jgi:flavin-dependent dehydrogenase
MAIRYTDKALPILRSCDVVVFGGSLAGIAAALSLSKAGRSVIVVEPRTYLGREITATLRPWVSFADFQAPELIKRLIETSPAGPGTEIPLHMDTVKRVLEDELLKNKVEILYASLAVATVVEEGCLTGLVIGNKSGRQVISASLVIDGSETALVARLAGLPLDTAAGSQWRRCIEITGVAGLEEGTLAVPADLGLSGNVVVHRGYIDPEHVILECTFDLPHAPDGLEGITYREMETRQGCMRLAAYLVKTHPAFQKIYVGGVAYDLFGRYTAGLVDMAELPAKLAQARLSLPQTGQQILELPLGAFATSYPNLWLLSEAARLPNDQAALMQDPLPAFWAGKELGAQLHVNWRLIQSSRAAYDRRAVEMAAQVQAYEIREPDSPQRGRNFERKTVSGAELPLWSEVDVLVAGGGTSGAVAALAASGEGVKTCVVEMNPGLGGTGTYGGVHSYWVGYKSGYVTRVKKWVNQAQKDLGLFGLKGFIPMWNIEAKAYALEKEFRRAGVALIYNAIVIGVIMDGNKVCGLVAATRLGPVALLGKIIVDASGDGDVAAFAGAQFVYGSARDHSVMWYVLAQLFKPGRGRNHFTSTVDVSNVEDYTRAILSERRRGQLGKDHDHGIYVATRESRHIVGDVTPSLTDQLLHRAWEDIICIAVSNNDIKGQTSSDWLRMGLISPHLEIEIPYGALLPKGLENILVVGKAISTTHDALPAIRMQPDFENLGAAGGVAAATAAKSGVTARGVDIKVVQTRMRKLKVLPKKFTERKLKVLHYSDRELKLLVDAILPEHPFYAYQDMRLNKTYDERIKEVDLCTAGPRVIPILEEALAKESDPRRQLMLAQLLAMTGSNSGVPVLVSSLQDMLSQENLPERNFIVHHVDSFAPDQAAMPSAGYLLYSLGMTRDRRALPIWQKVVDMLGSTAEEDVWSQRKGIFHYVDAVCVGAEQLGDPAAIPILEKLHSYPQFKHKVLSNGFQADYLLERPAYLEVVIGRALARCGASEGVIVLIDYLRDVRALLAEQAHSELIQISGEDQGKDIAAWSRWLERNGEAIKPTPWTVPVEAVLAWGEQVLVVEKQNMHKSYA